MNKKILPDVIDHIAKQYPDRTAIQTIEAGYNYTWLKRTYDSIASGLLDQLLSVGQPVGVFMPASEHYIATIIGVNKAGGVFLPLVPQYPPKRLSTIISVVSPDHFITTTRYKTQLLEQLKETAWSRPFFLLLITDGGESVWLERYTALSASPEISTPSVEAVTFPELEGDESNYMIYTSGSTGTPKIIEGRHKSLSHFIHWEAKELLADQHTRTSFLAPPSFDVSLRDIFLPLLTGGCICIPGEDIKLQPAAFTDWLHHARVSVIHIVPSLFRNLLEYLKENRDKITLLDGVKAILLAGEPLPGKDVNEWKRLMGDNITLYNLYGPSETTLAKVFNKLNESYYEPDEIIPLGTPIANTSILILNSENGLCNIGETGEIVIRTPFISKGYYKAQELTAQSFIQNPLHDTYEDIVYRTGDIGKYLDNGQIGFSGRKDWQVKIRGNRVEVQEVEAVIRKFSSIKQAIVLPLTRTIGDIALACYYTTNEPFTEGSLETFLSSYLPDYMMPSYWVPLPEFPLTLNGKIDRNALPRPEVMIYEKLSYKAPCTETEKLMAGIWKEVLNLSKVGVSNSFFEIGGHSLGATRVISLIYKMLGKQISLKDFFDLPTIQAQARLVDGMQENMVMDIIPLPEQDGYPVSYPQQRLWVMHQSGAYGGNAYNIPLAAVLGKQTDVAALKKALHVITTRHESLRTTFSFRNGILNQHIHPENIVSVVETDESNQPAEQMIKAAVNAMIASVFDLENGPLASISIIHLSDGKYLLLINMHHIISDGWSVGVLVHELATLYEAFSKGQDNPIPPLRIHYKDYVVWHQQLLQSKQDVLRQYWYTELEQTPPAINLPYDFVRPAKRTFTGSKYGFNLSRACSDYLRQLATEQDTTLFIIVQSILFTLLYHYSGQRIIVTGTPISGRDNYELENQIGFYLNYLVLKMELTGNESLPAFIDNVKRKILAAFAHQDYPYDKLVEDLIVDQPEDRNPFYDVLVVMNNADLNGTHKDYDTLERLTGLQGISIDDNISKLDLSFFVSDLDQILFNIEYNTSLFLPSTIEKMETDLRTIVELFRTDLHTLTINEISARLAPDDNIVLQANNLNIPDEQF